MANQEQPSTTAQNTPTLSLSLSLSLSQTKQLNKTKTITTCIDLYAALSNGAHHPKLILSHRYHPFGHHTGSLPCSLTRSNQCHQHILCPRWQCVRCYFHWWSLDWRWSLGRQWSLDHRWDGGLGDGAWGDWRWGLGWVGGTDWRWGNWPTS